MPGKVRLTPGLSLNSPLSNPRGKEKNGTTLCTSVSCNVDSVSQLVGSHR